MSSVGTILALVFVMVIGLGLGATTTKEDFGKALQNPRALFIGFGSQVGPLYDYVSQIDKTCEQYFFMPLVAYILAHVFQVKDEFAIGMILTGVSAWNCAIILDP
jgi:predicted Na+-dependent transporter